MTVIRPASAHDAQAICNLWNLHITTRLTTFNAAPKTRQNVVDMLVQRQADGHGTWLAEDEAGLLGFAYYNQFRSGTGYAHAMEHTIYLADAAAGRGLGRQLLGTVEDHARRSGAHVMMAGVSAANPDGLAFHTRCGYREVARLAELGRKFDQWFDLVLMQKFL